MLGYNSLQKFHNEQNIINEIFNIYSIDKKN